MDEKFKALKSGDSMDFWGNTHPKCPHCGRECVVSDLEWYECYEEGEHEVVCPSCEGSFLVSTTVSHSYSTDDQSGLEE